MGLNRKTISINMTIEDLARLDYAVALISQDIGFSVSRTNAINIMVSDTLKNLGIDNMDNIQYRLSLGYKRPSNEAKQVDRPEPDGHKTAREFSRSEIESGLSATTNSGKK